GQGDQGQGDQGQGDQGAPPNDVDLEIAASLGNAANSLTASITPNPKNIKVDWKAPHVRSDHVAQYEIWRVIDPNNVGVTTSPNGGTLATANGVPVGTTQNPPVLTFTDFSAKSNVWYTYFVVTVFDNGIRSGMSTTVRIKK